MRPAQEAAADPTDGTDLAAVVAERIEAAGAGLTPGCLDWAKAMDDLAEAFLREMPAGEGGSSLAALDAAVLVRRRTFRLLDVSLHGTVGLDLRNNLAVDLSSRYRRGGGLQDLLDSCSLGHQVLAGSGPGDLLAAAASLAGRLSMLARNPGHEAELDDAVRLLSEALGQSADDDPARPIALTSMAGLLVHRWQRDGDVAALGRAVAGLPVGEITGATPCAVNVAELLIEYGEQTHDLALLQRGEALLREAAEMADPGEAATVRGSLANALITRFDLDGDEDRLTEAIRLAEAAVTATPPGPERAEHLSSLAAARSALARLNGDRQLLDTAIEDARAAAEEPATHASDRSGAVNALAMLLAERYDLLGDSADLEQSIALYDGFLDQPDVSADARPALLTNLANVLLSKFERDGDAADVHRAAALTDGAIQATHPDSVHLAGRHDTAGRIRAAIAYHLGSPDDGRLAEQHARAAVETTPQGSPDRAHYLNNWAMWVTDRWERTGDPTALGQAIELLDSALAAVAGDGQLRATISFNLGVRWQEKFERDLNRGEADWADLQRACDLLDDALAADLPHLTLPAGKRLGDIAWRVSMWPEAEHALRLAMTAAGELSGLRPLRPDKRRARSGVQGIGALAALCAARSGDAQAAAVHLEQASATLLAEALGVRGDTIRFGDITGACRSMGRSLLFMGSTPAAGLAVLADEGGGCRVAELPLLTDEAVLAATTAFRKVLADAMADSGDGTEDPLEACYAAGSRFLDWTWTSVLAPLDELLARTGGLAVLPLGQLAWLPLTAAGPPGMAPALAPHEPVLLIRATAGRESPLAGDRAVPPEVALPPGAPPEGAPRALVWADTGPADRAIPGVLDEARQIAAVYPDARLRLHDRQPRGVPADTAPLRSAGSGPARAGAAPTTEAPATDALIKLLRSADIVHLACHCDVNPEHPDDTILQLDPPVRVGNMGVGGLGPRTHVVLSACDAALTSSSLPDEALSPATALLLAGAGTVTAPVWPVDDEATTEFMAAYHRELASGLEPGRALSQVQTRWAERHQPVFLYAPWVVVVRPTALAAPHPAPEDPLS